ncbi:Flp pilus assembly complex ATPase component TadA [Patescibacteria group bacterium]|nr:Flp pilus assembly complex ATPase component TadA [Patescibacteria group bacterium]
MDKEHKISNGVEINNDKLKDLLVPPGHISESDFDNAVQEAEIKKIPLTSVLVEKGLISDEHLGKAIADAFDYNFIDLKKAKIPNELLDIIPEIVVRSQQAVAFELKGNVLRIATTQPENYEFFKLLEKKSGYEIEIYYATAFGIEEALKYYKSDLGLRVKKIIEKLEKNSQAEEEIVNLVNLFLEYAHDNKASDIHIEPLNNIVSVRFRIDGVLHEVANYPISIHEKIVFRIKIMSKLRTDEHAASQDGRFDYKVGSNVFDVRVSIMPVTDGENVVLRLLSERSRRLSLEDLGLWEADFKKVKRAASKPYGMLLAAGPTGSGKTTTLYALLQILNKPEVNIMTIEDPVEYDVERVQQTQVNAKKNLNFATGLRSIVRQDPDIIMVGEIRDNETADIAINAAMTGHLLLSTLHANDAATAFPRLIEMGIEPFLVASSVNVIIAQRLVRKICEQCRKSYFLSKEELKMIKSEPQLLNIIQKVSGEKDISKIRFFKGGGCKVCNNVGYSGRTGIFEVMEVNDDVRPLIVQKTSSDIIEKKAGETGMTSMLYDGIMKVFQGVTTLDEVIRVTKS